MQNLRKTVYMTSVLAAVAAAFGYSIYAGLTDAGPCRVLAEWQLDIFGRYSRVLNILILLFPLVGLAVTWMTLAGRILVPDVRRAALAARGTNPMGRGFGQPGRQHILRRLNARPHINLVVSIALVAGGAALGYAMTERSQAVVTAQDIDLGTAEPPRADYVRLSGIARTDLALTVKTEHRWGTSVETYVPIVPRDWRRDRPLVYLLHSEQQEVYFITARPRSLPLAANSPSGPESVVAAATSGRLPYRVGQAFDESHLSLADNPVILDLELHPYAAWFREAAWLLALAGYFLFFIALLYWAAGRQTPGGAQAAGEAAR